MPSGRNWPRPGSPNIYGHLGPDYEGGFRDDGIIVSWAVPSLPEGMITPLEELMDQVMAAAFLQILQAAEFT